MAAVVTTDYSIATNGDIRYTGTTTNNTVIEFHRWLGDLMDDALATGNDLLDITDATASERSTDNIITLKAPFNIDNTVAQHLFDGSIIQTNGDEIYDGILVFAAAGTPLQILQNGKPAYPNFWGTSINADSANGISHRFMLKVKTAAADIDGRRLVGQTRETGKTYSEFKINGTARGNNVLALTYATDLNNATAEATIRGWTTITNTEGYRLLDVDNNSLTENYYSEWNRAALTINQFFERHKWLTRESTVESSNANSGASNFQVANATIIGQSQSFANGVNAQYLTRVRVKMRKVEGTPGTVTGNLTAKLYNHSGATFGTDSIPGVTLHATSENFDVATLTTAYKEYEIAFGTAGATAHFLMVASTNYCIAFEHAAINGSNYVEIQGDGTAGNHPGNRAQLVASTWTPTAADNLDFKVYASPKQYGIRGEIFRGITHEVVADTPSAAFSAVEAISWPGGTGQLLASVFPDTTATALSVNASLQFARATGSFITDGFRPGMTIVSTVFTTGANNTTKIISSLTATTITVTDTTGLVQEAAGTDERIRAGHIWMQLLTGIAPTDNQTITGGTSSTTALMNVTITERTLSQPAVGASTGTAIIGSYGLGVEPIPDLSASDKVTDLSNTLRVPPNNVTFTVAGLVSGEDRVLVAPLGYEFAYDTEAVANFALGDSLTFGTPTGTGYLSLLRDDGTTGRMQIRLLSGSVPTDNSTITNGTATALVNGSVVASEDPRQLILTAVALSGGAVTTVPCTTAIPTDTPSAAGTTGSIRIRLASGLFRNIAYTSYSGNDFTIPSTDFSADNAPASTSIFIAYIDKAITGGATTATFTGVYSADRNLFVRVRDGASTPIKTFETTGTLGSAGGSATAIRTSDA
ncbi:MAG: hypothetical protein WC610_01005 [Patescibacteria group bacterium]